MSLRHVSLPTSVMDVISENILYLKKLLHKNLHYLSGMLGIFNINRILFTAVTGSEDIPSAFCICHNIKNECLQMTTLHS